MNLKLQNENEKAGKSGSLFVHLMMILRHGRNPFVAVLIGLGLFIGTIYTSVPLSEFWVKNVDLKPGMVAAMGVTPNFDTFQGSILQEMAFANSKILPLYGSSEMSMIYDYHPAQVFTPETGVTPFLIGKGGTQTLIHVLNLAALGDEVRGKKLAIFLTPQWFGSGGISESTFAGNFSALHAYEIMQNPQLSPQLKQEVAQRLLQFPTAYQDFPYLEKLLALQAKPGWSSPILRLVYAVPSQMEYASLALQDAVKTDWQVKRLPRQTVARYSGNASKLQIASSQVKKSPGAVAYSPIRLQWDQLRTQAVREGKASTDNNPFGMDNGFYASNILPKLQEREGSDKNAEYSSSPEYSDLKLLMKVLKEEGAKPLFVILPMNGRWSDYTGISSTERQNGYQRLAQMVQTEGFALADFSSHEKDDYYLRDPWHLAWKGWVDVDEALDQFYRSN
ncbi:D-alanyl-lipoteichoic acid biosynthesis protein DltD [Desulfitobacterium sp.]|uniref:D-alanyl-lipoteichoic acid biosynthesis protein DltD n=1 Tax=Desulfitobacterium sp. TaxID=49981 RepID=UPI002BD79423|nr:D-alanyl-lipoteichoic acid biosynthesis protein DltD [Desulfitobacterium sp.]HVJ50594.1 D-alanyl-lipoteichoic acid biosynthesis protein DltD [Desulfitobacterium sp.]